MASLGFLLLIWGFYYFDLQLLVVEIVKCFELLFSATFGTFWTVGMGGLIISPHEV